MKDAQETKEGKDVKPAQDQSAGLGAEGIRAVQGVEPAAAQSEGNNTADPPNPSLVEGKPVPIEELSQPPYDPSKLKYEIGSPHQDYQAYKDLQAAKRRHELRQQAATAESLPDAIDTTLAARKEAKGSDEETPMDEYFYQKYGRAPYTTD